LNSDILHYLVHYSPCISSSQALSDDESSVASSNKSILESEGQVPITSPVEEPRKILQQTLSSDWKQYSVMVKTSSVVTLSLCRVIGDLLLASGEVFQISHLDQLLTALEAQYWHTLLFHGNPELLSCLALKGFVVIVPGPHLIDQEVQSAKIILRTITDIYLSSDNKENKEKDTSDSGSSSRSSQQLDEFVAPWISRCVRHCVLCVFFEGSFLHPVWTHVLPVLTS
jgi:hypothetical protein